MSRDEAVQKFQELSDQYVSYQSWIEKAQSQQGSFRPEVVRKVVSDYTQRCKDLIGQLVPLRADIQAEIRELRAEIDSSAKEVGTLKSQREEIELRCLIGEINEDERDAEIDALEASHGGAAERNAEVNDRLHHLEDLLSRVDLSGGAPEPAYREPARPEPVVEAPRAAPEPIRAEPMRPPPEPVRAEPVRVEAARTEAPRTEPVRAEPVRPPPEPIRSEPRHDQVRVATLRASDVGRQPTPPAPSTDMMMDDLGPMHDFDGPDLGHGDDGVGGGFGDLGDFASSMDDSDLDGIGLDDGGGSLMDDFNFINDLPLGEEPPDLPPLGNTEGHGGGLEDFPDLGSEWQNALGDDFGGEPELGGGAASVATAAAGAARRGYLIRNEGSEGEEYFEINDDVLTLGRGRDNRIQIKEDTKVSRYHCRLFKEGNVFYIEDNNSSNGTLVNGELISKRILEGGEEVSIGETFFRFTIR